MNEEIWAVVRELRAEIKALTERVQFLECQDQGYGPVEFYGPLTTRRESDDFELNPPHTVDPPMSNDGALEFPDDCMGPEFFPRFPSEN